MAMVQNTCQVVEGQRVETFGHDPETHLSIRSGDISRAASVQRSHVNVLILLVLGRTAGLEERPNYVKRFSHVCVELSDRTLARRGSLAGV